MTLTRLRLSSSLPPVPLDRPSRVTLAHHEQGVPVFWEHPATGGPVTLVVVWAVDAAGDIREDRLDEVHAARWDVDPAAWARLDELARMGFKLGGQDLILWPVDVGCVRPGPTWHNAAAVTGRDLTGIVDLGLALLRAALEVDVPQGRAVNRPPGWQP